jgi:hypothetical protein
MTSDSRSSNTTIDEATGSKGSPLNVSGPRILDEMDILDEFSGTECSDLPALELLQELIALIDKADYDTRPITDGPRIKPEEKPIPIVPVHRSPPSEDEPVPIPSGPRDRPSKELITPQFPSLTRKVSQFMKSTGLVLKTVQLMEYVTMEEMIEWELADRKRVYDVVNGLRSTGLVTKMPGYRQTYQYTGVRGEPLIEFDKVLADLGRKRQERDRKPNGPVKLQTQPHDQAAGQKLAKAEDDE